MQVGLFLGSLLHAKLYLLHRQDHAAPRIAKVGSSHLTFSGLKQQSELNIDLIDVGPACPSKHPCFIKLFSNICHNRMVGKLER